MGDGGEMDGGVGLQPPFDLPESPCPEDGVALAPTIVRPQFGTAQDGPYVDRPSVTVECRASELAVEEVAIRRLIAPGVPAAPAPPVTNEGDLYRATFDFSEEPNGFIAFDCLAEGQDAAGESACGYATVSTWLDLGPELRVASPTPDAFVPRNFPLRFDVIPVPFSMNGDDDALVAPMDVTVIVAGQTISLGEDITAIDAGDPQAGLRVNTDVDLTDEAIFPGPIDGMRELQIRATNGRRSIRSVVQVFAVDDEGPEIRILEPALGELVGGLVTVRAEVTDPAGVNEDTIDLRLPGVDMPRRFTAVSGRPDEFIATFDASIYGVGDPSIVLNVIAEDLNENASTATQNVRLDSVPPLADLDPVDVRVIRETGEDVLCSELFDPVGADSVNDGAIVGPDAEFRARIEDQGNETSGDGVVVFVSGIARADLYIFQPDSETDARELLTSGVAGAACDDITADVLPESPMGGDPATVVELLAVRPAGSPAGDPDAEGWPAGEPAEAYGGGAVFAYCSGANGTDSPRLLCEESSPLSTVISNVSDRSLAAVYAPGPVGGSNCVGSPVNVSRLVDAGRWACAAVRVEDELGNVSVSAPVRFCLVEDAGESCDEPLPDCMDGCATPQSFADSPRYQRVDP
ncbi:MAG: hypothetical protein AAF447_21805 [Myxococcota bacterium]